jgi:hypothetical protein
MLRDLLQDGAKTVYELSTLLFPHVYQKQLSFTLSETLGHIDLLQLLQQLEVEKRDGILYYSL